MANPLADGQDMIVTSKYYSFGGPGNLAISSGAARIGILFGVSSGRILLQPQDTHNAPIGIPVSGPDGYKEFDWAKFGSLTQVSWNVLVPAAADFTLIEIWYQPVKRT